MTSSKNVSGENSQEADTAISPSSHSHTEDMQKVIQQRFAGALLKLEHFVHVPSTAVDEFLD